MTSSKLGAVGIEFQPFYFLQSLTLTTSEWPITYSSQRLLRLSNSPTELLDVLSPAKAMIGFRNIDQSLHVSAPRLSITTLDVESSTKRPPKSETVKHLINPCLLSCRTPRPMANQRLKHATKLEGLSLPKHGRMVRQKLKCPFSLTGPLSLITKTLTKCLPKCSPTLCQFNIFSPLSSDVFLISCLFRWAHT